MGMDPDGLLLTGGAVLFVAGLVKGFVGLGLPTVAMGLLTLSLDPRTALSLILVPMLASNLWQMARGGDLAGNVVRHWRLALVLVGSVAATVWLTRDAPDRVMLAILGVALVAFALASWRRIVPEIAPNRVRIWELLTGLAAGVTGGMTGGWAAPLAMYLAARRVAPEEFMRASGFLIAAGSIPLIAGYAALGLASGPTLGLSASLLIPTILGFSAGEALRRRLDPDGFRTALIVVFLGLGLDLLRRAILA